MTNGTQVLKGIVRGKTVELEREPDLPDGQSVSVVLSATGTGTPGEGLRQSFGAWADVDPAEFDAFLEQVRRDRKVSRPAPPP